LDSLNLAHWATSDTSSAARPGYEGLHVCLTIKNTLSLSHHITYTGYQKAIKFEISDAGADISVVGAEISVVGAERSVVLLFNTHICLHVFE